jgi:hypothetical protein
MRAAAIWVRIMQRQSVYRPPAGRRPSALTTRRPGVRTSPAAPAISPQAPRMLHPDSPGYA